MLKALDQQQLDYTLYHLAHHVEGWHLLQHLISYGELNCNMPGKIYFRASPDAFDQEKVIYIDDIPVLFPRDINKDPWELNCKGGLLFNHDLLKSAFYLLSGYHERVNQARVDSLSRFDYNHSIQKILDIIHKPVVNYYFDLIIQGLMAFSSFHGLDVKRRDPCGEAILLMTHDVDRVKFFTARSLLGRWARALHPGNNLAGYNARFKLAIGSARGMLLPLNHPANVFWSFPFLLEAEGASGIRSTWFMLNRQKGEPAADYDFSQPEIRDLVNTLAANGHEVALHGSISSNAAPGKIAKEARYFERCFGFYPAGARQHYLCGEVPLLFREQVAAGLKYDSTMGFSGREGYRHSYCHPFKPFDHDKGICLDLWEIPLVAMDTTLFTKRGLTPPEALASILSLAKEAARFKGLFTFLWHNCRANSWENEGMEAFYTIAARELTAILPLSLTCSEAISMFEQKISQVP